MVWCGVVWFGLVCVVLWGLVWFHLVWYGLVWFALTRTCVQRRWLLRSLRSSQPRLRRSHPTLLRPTTTPITTGNHFFAHYFTPTISDGCRPPPKHLAKLSVLYGFPNLHSESFNLNMENFKIDFEAANPTLNLFRTYFFHAL